MADPVLRMVSGLYMVHVIGTLFCGRQVVWYELVDIFPH